MCKLFRLGWIALFLAMLAAPLAHSLEKQPAGVYRARRVALAQKLHGGVAVLPPRSRCWTLCLTARMRTSII
jgi:hypothetical protein